jgi:hypothetical protein
MVDAEAFFPDMKHPRSNGDVETSINWEDDDSVERRTLSDANGRFGAARLPLAEVARARRRTTTADAVFAERTNNQGENPYHGDIVFRKTATPRQRKMIANSFALESAFVPPTAR